MSYLMFKTNSVILYRLSGYVCHCVDDFHARARIRDIGEYHRQFQDETWRTMKQGPLLRRMLKLDKTVLNWYEFI